MASDSALAVAEVLVVGAGSAGCVVAERLSRDPARRVVLLEAGPAAAPAAAQTRLTRLPIGPGAPRVLRYPEVRGRDVVRGTGLGGSSTVNGGYFLRGHRADYDCWPWPIEEIAEVLDWLDGGPDGGGAMSVSAFADDELGTLAAVFDAYWRQRAAVGPVDAWPVIGLNRVRSNRVRSSQGSSSQGSSSQGSSSQGAGRRFTAAEAFPTSTRENLRTIGDAPVRRLVTHGGRITGVQTARGRIDAPTVVLTAGTLGTAALMLPLLDGPLPVHEHAERLVRFVPRLPLRASALLQVVVHTADGLEIRCYGDDFASFIEGVPASGAPLGVADMAAGTAGSLHWDGALRVDLGEPHADSVARIAGGVEQVRQMLDDRAFAELVRPGTVYVDPAVGMSSHAWGSLPAGTAVGLDGALPGITGLHVADGSILPGQLRSGPHSGVMAAAALVARRLAT